MDVHVFYVLKLKTSKKNSFLLSVCLSVWLYVCRAVGLTVCLSVCMSICTWILALDTITFEGVNESKQNLVGVFYL